jgi:ATP-dependent helicase/DNAse subunit B
VPDKFSLTLEKSILSALKLEGSVNIKVMSFTRFAAVSLKNKIKKCLTPEGSVMLLQKVIGQKKDQLLCYKNVATMQGFEIGRAHV